MAAYARTPGLYENGKLELRKEIYKGTG